MLGATAKSKKGWRGAGALRPPNAFVVPENEKKLEGGWGGGRGARGR